jgi:hypothetical protein
MTRVTGYKCIFQTNEERFKFALTLTGGDGEGDFTVANADAAETLLDMFEDSSEAHFDAASGELTFTFDELKTEEEEGEEHEEEDESDAETEEHASSHEASEEEEEDQEGETDRKKKEASVPQRRRVGCRGFFS